MNIIILSAVLTVDYAHANNELWNKLAEGGYVILMRHASVETGRDNGNSLSRDPSCNEERNLSTDGYYEAKEIGEIFRDKKIPISKVLHSPFCRTTDTAKLAFDTGSPAEFLSLLEILSPEESTLHTNKLNQIIGSYKGKGNLILITHGPNINAVSFELVKHSEFLILKPAGEDLFDELGIIRPTEK